ncbi:hypothetical protein [Haliscomenobacter hydrossis]|uniref:hypothetical protein n=1 Tax=Haliscomenobacter hydrossis TaxID=2350 RepID=UPI0005C7A2B6|nr:hypothetical protein [Haliscomenobacter hydrossis]
MYPLLLICLWTCLACQPADGIEKAIPTNALAILTPRGSTEQFPFSALDWHQVLLPLAKGRTGILYLTTTVKDRQITSPPGYDLWRTTQLRGIKLQHFRSAQAENWVLAQVKGFSFLSTEASLVEEAVLDFKNGRNADWVKPTTPPEIQFNYPAFARFLGIKDDPLIAQCQNVRLKLGLPSGQLQGQVHFTAQPPTNDLETTAVLSIIPAEANAVSPIWVLPENASWLGDFSSRSPWLLHLATGNAANTACLFPFEDQKQAQEALRTIAGRFGALPAYTYQTYTLQPVLDLGLHQWGIRQATLAVIDRHLVIAASADLMERWVDALVVDNTMARQLQHPPAGLWMRLSTAIGLGQAIARLTELLPLNLDLSAVFQLEGDVEKNRWTFTSAATLEPLATKPTALWQIDLPDERIEQIWAVDAWESCVLETNQQHLVLLDKMGTLRWTKKLEGPVLGKLQSVYRKERKQNILYFATATAIHALQQNGQEEPGYPINLGLRTTSGVSVGGRDVYLFYASVDGRIYGLDHEGAPLSGWNPGPRLGAINQPLGFFQSAAADYLLALTDAGELHVLDRATQPHFPVQTLKGPFLSPAQWQWDQLSQRIVVADGKGKAQVFNEKGKPFPLAISRGKSQAAQLCFTDLIGDGRKDYLSANGTDLFLHAYVGDAYELIFQKSFNGQITALTAHGRDENARIVCSIPSMHQVWCLSTKGEVIKGFPVAGDKFAFFPQQKLVVTTIDNRVYAYGLEAVSD